jgi:hypothetical protein
MLHDAQLGPSFWGEAAMAFTLIHNCSPTSALSCGVTPYQVWHSAKPSVAHFRVFGSTAYVHVPKAKRCHLESHTMKCIMIGYEAGTKAWRLWDPAGRRVLISRDVIFDESGHTSSAVISRPSSTLSPPQRLVQFPDDVTIPLLECTEGPYKVWCVSLDSVARYEPFYG